MPTNKEFFQVADKLLEKRGYWVIGYKEPWTKEIGDTVERFAQYPTSETLEVIDTATPEEWDRQIIELLELAKEMGQFWKGTCAHSSSMHKFYRVTYKKLAADYRRIPVEETSTVTRKFRLSVRLEE